MTQSLPTLAITVLPLIGFRFVFALTLVTNLPYGGTNFGWVFRFANIIAIARTGQPHNLLILSSK